MIKLKNMSFKKKTTNNPNESLNSGFISSIHNSLNSRSKINQKAQFNIKKWFKKINYKKLPMLKNNNKKNKDKILYVNIIKKDEIIYIKKTILKTI
jgi:hypothetical protein